MTWITKTYGPTPFHFSLPFGVTQVDLAKRTNGDDNKVELTRRLRQETTITLEWTAECLQMGSWTYVSNVFNQPGDQKCQ